MGGFFDTISIGMKRLRSGGFTIVELLVVIIACGLFIGAVHVLITSNIHLNEKTRDAVVVNSFVEAKVESIRSAGFSGTPIGTTTITNELPSELKSPRSATLAITNESGSPAIKRVLITVSYNDQGLQQTYSYATFIGEIGVGQ